MSYRPSLRDRLNAALADQSYFPGKMGCLARQRRYRPRWPVRKALHFFPGWFDERRPVHPSFQSQWPQPGHMRRAAP